MIAATLGAELIPEALWARASARRDLVVGGFEYVGRTRRVSITEREANTLRAFRYLIE